MYFEIVILCPKKSSHAPRLGDLPVGLAISHPGHQPWVVPGTEGKPGFTGDGHVLLQGFGEGVRLSPPWAFNDVIGYGVDLDRRRHFWSRNGALLGSRPVDVECGPFYAMVGLKSSAVEVKVQLQQSKFMFNLNVYLGSQFGSPLVIPMISGMPNADGSPGIIQGLSCEQYAQRGQLSQQSSPGIDPQEGIELDDGKEMEDQDEGLDFTGKDQIEYHRYTFLPEVGEGLVLGDVEDEFAVHWKDGASSANEIALIQSSGPLQPLNPDGQIDESGRRRRLYFEVELNHTDAQLKDAPFLAIGWSNRNLLKSGESVAQLPGHQVGTWALQDTGTKFGEGVSSDYTHTLVGPLVLGCGLDLDSGQAFFTLNGAHLGTAFRSIGSPVSSKERDDEEMEDQGEEGWWAIVGLRKSTCRVSLRLVPPFSYVEAFEELGSEDGGEDGSEVDFVRPLPLGRTVSSENRELRTQLEQLEDERTCVVCYAEARDAVFLPCAHLVSCVTCAVTVKECPMCRKEVTSHLRIFSS